ncbi:MAG: hypothetical protein CVU71_16870 [Deltaproteobacteria bacterium HGW-Deltaproteobacteria-6]|jgi:hypothetical protein|nr:MAG: hypothetical protein CVU71_16870 [Deltaproteobacteria bacterium HGW-Deltaproteobacteria-6]
MTVRISAQEISYPHLNKKELTNDIWFYREECRYLREAWIIHPKDYQPESLIDNTDPKNYFAAEGLFSIPGSFYMAPSLNNDPNADRFTHFNAVDAVICFNQLGFIQAIEGGMRELLPFSHFNIDINSLRTVKTTINILIAKINTTFVRPIDPTDFTGMVTITKMYYHKGLPFAETEYSFQDNKGGLAVGSARTVMFVQNLKD